jgi:hypothetical protein
MSLETNQLPIRQEESSISDITVSVFNHTAEQDKVVLIIYGIAEKHFPIWTICNFICRDLFQLSNSIGQTDSDFSVMTATDVRQHSSVVPIGKRTISNAIVYYLSVFSY